MLKPLDKSRKIRSNAKFTSTPPAFLLKTYEILENSDYFDIIAWNREGDAFIVKKLNDFGEKVLPKYFKHNNFQSFVRQLNMYDFHKSRQENHENIFKHPLFRRGHKELLKNIKRKATLESFSNMIPQLNNSQITPLLVPSSQDFDLERYNKDYHVFMQELINLKTKQEDLQHVTTILIQQNNEILSENKILFNELLKNRDKKDKKFDKFFQMVMHFFLNNASSLPQLQTQQQQSPPQQTSPEPTQNNKTSLCPFPDPELPIQDNSSTEKILKKLLKSLQNKQDNSSTATNPSTDYKFSSFLDNYYEKNSSLLQNLMKYLGSGGEPNSELFSKLLGKRPASLDLSSSLKYLDDSIFNKRKKSKKFKGKREEEEFKLPALYKNEESLKLEQPFQGYFNQNKMLTNFPNNQPNFSNIQEQTNNFNNNHGFVSNNNTNNEPFNELFQNYPVNCYNNSNINPAFSGGSLGGFLEGGLGLSRRNSLNEEFQDNYNFTGNMNMESPLRSNNYAFSPLLPNISSLGRNPIKDEEIDDKGSSISLNLDKLEN